PWTVCTFSSFNLLPVYVILRGKLWDWKVIVVSFVKMVYSCPAGLANLYVLYHPLNDEMRFINPDVSRKAMVSSPLVRSVYCHPFEPWKLKKLVSVYGPGCVTLVRFLF